VLLRVLAVDDGQREEGFGVLGWAGAGQERVGQPCSPDFLHGSPSVLVDGEDPFAEPGADVGLSCRLYRTPVGLAGAPTMAHLVEVLADRCAPFRCPVTGQRRDARRLPVTGSRTLSRLACWGMPAEDLGLLAQDAAVGRAVRMPPFITPQSACTATGVGSD